MMKKINRTLNHTQNKEMIAKKKGNKTVYKNDKVSHSIFDFSLSIPALGAADSYFGIDLYVYKNEAN